MIVTTESTAINNSGFTSSNFSMKHSAHAFKILTTSLYTNKEKAVLREYFANAYDAIAEAGKTDPVVIQLPTEMEPNLVISDNGVGMDKDQLTKLYSTFFDSTKQANNEAIGGFGLGSKSAFSISDTFTVTSVKDNQSTTIVAYIDGGIPKLVVTNESTTTEPSGTTVTIPVSNSTTQRRLKEEVTELFVHTPVTPKVTLGASSPLTLKTKSNYEIYNNSMYFTHSYQDFDEVVVGLFSYTIPESLATRISNDPAFKTLYASFKKTAIADCLNFILPLGAVELSPSRETIEDTPANAKVLLDIIKPTLTKYLSEIASFTPTVYKFLSEFIKADLSTYQKYQDKLKELTDAVPKPILDAIDNQLYRNDYKNNFALATIHESLGSDWFYIGSDKSISRVNNIFNFGKWYSQSPLKTISVKKLNSYRSKAQTIETSFKAPKDVIYITNTKGANITRCYNHRSTTIEHEGTEISLFDIYSVENKEDYDKAVAVFADYVIEIPNTHFDVKATRKTTTPSVRTPKSEIKVFFVEFDSTNTYSGELTTDFYSETLSSSTNLVVLSYSLKSDHHSWQNVPALVYSPTPVLVLRELRSGETKSKRFTEFVKPYPLQILNYYANPGNADATYAYYKTNYSYWKSFFLVVNTLDKPSIRYEEPKRLTKLALYHFISTETEFKYYKKLLPKNVYRNVFDGIWKTYQLGNSISDITNDLLNQYKSSKIIIGMPSEFKDLKLTTTDYPPLKMLSMGRYYRNNFYDWILAQPNVVTNLKTIIHPQLGV